VVIYYLFPIVTPFLAAIVFAVLLEPIVLFFMKGKINRQISVVITYLMFMGTMATLLYFSFKTVIKQVIELYQIIPTYIPYIIEWFKQMEEYFVYLDQGIIDSLLEQLKSMTTAPNGVVNAIAGGSLDVATWIPGFLIVMIVFLIALFLFSLHLPGLKRGFLNLFSDDTKKKVDQVLHDLNRAIIGFLRAQFILSLLIYFLSTAGLLIIGTPYPFAIGLFIIIVDVLPILGTGSVLIPWAIYSFLYDETSIAFGLMVLFIVITVIRRIAEPKVLGESLGISTIATLISIYLGFALLGIKGLILGPIIVIIFNALRKVGLFHYKFKF
ncbi:MAG: sporulation integral membrane protein YtvI, partial [Bacilli bacterium]